MIASATQIYVASQTAHQLIVVDPPYTLFGILFPVIGGLMFFILGFGALIFARSHGRPIALILWLVPIIAGAPFLILGIGIGTESTTITLSPETMSVSKTILSLPVSSRQYPLSRVSSVQVGIGDVCHSLFVNLTDAPSEDLTGCTDRTGYGIAARSINAFLDANRP
jgi:hypothetical protein